MEDWKIKIAVLWLVFECFSLLTAILELWEPGFIEGLIAGEIAGIQLTPEMILVFAIILVIPPVMAFLSLTLKDSINRWANIIVGAVFTVIGLAMLGDAVAKLSAYASLMWLSIVVVTALIVWYAWKSKQKA